MFYQTITATLAPLLFSKISLSLGASGNPAVYGTVISIFASAGYWGSIPFWYLAGKSYKKNMEERQ